MKQRLRKEIYITDNQLGVMSRMSTMKAIYFFRLKLDVPFEFYTIIKKMISTFILMVKCIYLL